MKKSANRKRDKTLSVRLTETEKEKFISQARAADLSLTDFILQAAAQKKIRVVNMSKVIIELKQIGNTINEIARRSDFDESASNCLSQIYAEQRKIYDLLLSIMGNS